MRTFSILVFLEAIVVGGSRLRVLQGWQGVVKINWGGATENGEELRKRRNIKHPLQ
jgi:hypothetical protein